jgi:general secretion pathway protein D
MSRFSVLVLTFLISCSIILAQGTTVIQTPFGPKEVPASENPPATQTPPPAAQTPAPTTQPATPVAVPAVPSPAENPNPAAARPEPQAATPLQGDTAGVALHIVNGDIRQVIQIIAEALKLNYVVDPGVHGTVDINTSETLPRSELMPVLESILKINNATMIRSGSFYQIVPSNTAAKQPIEVVDQRARVAPDDQVVMQILRMKFVAATEISKILTQYLSEAGSIVAHDVGNIILITDRRSNIRKLLEIVDEFDTAVLQGERIRLLPVKSNNARDVIEDLKTIFSGYGLSDKSAIRFIAIDRLNSILVVTPNPAVFTEIERWLGTLDQPVATAGTRNFVYKVKNAKASDLQKVLADLYGQTALSMAGGPTNLTAYSQPPNPPNPVLANPSNVPANGPATNGTGQQNGLPRGATTTSFGIRIIADETNNALVVQATAQQYAEILRTLEDLDVLRRQVLIDAQVFEVVLDDSLSFGVSAKLQNRDLTATRQTTAAVSSPTGLDVSTFAFIGRTRELLMFLNATENRSKVKTLSAPSVMVTDNGQAQFEVGTEVPIPTSSTPSTVQSGGSTLFAQTIQFRNTGVILQVKPQINEGGNVTLDISQEISQAGANNISSLTTAPVIGKSAVTSQIVVEDGQTIAIGGFIRENNDIARNRVPLVGRIPIAGALFGSTTSSKTRSELIVLITPHVLRTHQEADVATDELKTKLKEIKGLLK